MRRYAVQFDQGAEADLASIRDYIADARGRAFAEAFVDRIVTYCEGLATLPHRGTLRDHIAPGLRTTGWRKTVTVAFQVNDEGESVIILGVYYRGRDVMAALRQRLD